MGETFFGPWSVVVASKDADFDERLVISGSDTSDGAYTALPGTGPGTVRGTRWSIELEWNDNVGSGWQPSDVRRSARFTVGEGLVVDLGADDNFPNVRDGDYNDVVVTCRSENPEHTPLHPVMNPYDFSLPKEVFERFRETQGKEGEHKPKEPHHVDPTDGK